MAEDMLNIAVERHRLPAFKQAFCGLIILKRIAGLRRCAIRPVAAGKNQHPAQHALVTAPFEEDIPRLILSHHGNPETVRARGFGFFQRQQCRVTLPPTAGFKQRAGIAIGLAQPAL